MLAGEITPCLRFALGKKKKAAEKEMGEKVQREEGAKATEAVLPK